MLHAELLIDGHFIGGPCDQSIGKDLIRSPWDGLGVGTAAEGGLSELRTAIAAAHDAFKTWRFSPRQQRQDLLRQTAELIRERADELADLMSREIGKPITWARAEVARTAITFDLAADALSSFGFEQLPADFDPRGTDYRIAVERVPLGPILAIVPYNWPLNLAAHKLAPALATGNTVILKPSPLAPLSTLNLARIIHEAGCPAGVLNTWHGPTPNLEREIMDPRIKMVSFTGSESVGWALKQKLWDRPVTLELGGNHTAIVCEDADFDWALPRIVSGAYGYAGQVCIAVQHVLIHSSRLEEAKAKLIELTVSCPTGDPAAPETVCGPMIHEDAAKRVESWIAEAVEGGANQLAGGPRLKTLLPPTLLENVPATSKLATEEVFGPVLTIAPFDSLEDAIAQVNSSRFGIQCGVFTRSEETAERAFQQLEVGGVIINDFPTLRFDNMPYGGVKRSGFGREGVRYAMDEMTTPKSRVIRT